MTVTLSAAKARQHLISHLALDRMAGRGVAGSRKVLERLRCIQLDPLDVIGTNADLVIMARVDEAARGDVWKHLFPHHAFEHFAKERCILPAAAFPHYRQQGHRASVRWWRHDERESRVTKEQLAAVLDEVKKRGPLTAREMTDHGRVTPIDWSGWKSTASVTTMAIEILWTVCEIVVSGRTENGAKIYDTPERTFGELAKKKPREDFARWALQERVTAAGLLSRAGGAHWSMLSDVRTSPLPDEMIEAGELVEVGIEDSSRRYLAIPAFLKRRRITYDDRVRILGPLDPLLWDRNLVKSLFGFEYVWEVYKPEKQRRWGWYVCPLLFRDALVGRIDARVEKKRLVVKKLWIEGDVPREKIDAALERHALACGASKVSVRRTVGPGFSSPA